MFRVLAPQTSSWPQVGGWFILPPLTRMLNIKSLQQLMIGSKHRNSSLRLHYNYTNSLFNKYKSVFVSITVMGIKIVIVVILIGKYYSPLTIFHHYDDRINRFSFIFFYSEENTVIKSGSFTLYNIRTTVLKPTVWWEWHDITDTVWTDNRKV